MVAELVSTSMTCRLKTALQVSGSGIIGSTSVSVWKETITQSLASVLLQTLRTYAS